MKRLFSCLWLTAAVLGLTVFCTTQFTGITRGPTYILRYGDNQPADYPTTQGGQYFADLVYERTHGDVKVYVYPDEALGEEGDVIRQIQFGGIDMARVSPISTATPNTCGTCSTGRSVIRSSVPSEQADWSDCRGTMRARAAFTRPNPSARWTTFPA